MKPRFWPALAVLGALAQPVLTQPVLAQQVLADTDCGALWGRVAADLEGNFTLTGRPGAVQDGFCVLNGVEIGFPFGGIAMDRLMVKGAALDWYLGTDTPPTGLEMRIAGLRVLTRTGSAAMDYVAAAQARLSRSSVSFLLSWDATAKILRLDRLHADLPGNNAVYMTAEVAQVDLSSPGAMQASLTGFAVTALEVEARSHGMFEWYVLPVLAGALLPLDGDAEGAVKTLKAQAKALIADLPDASFPEATRDAATRLVDAMPNPSGRLRLNLQADPGLGPVRFAGFALTGVPTTMAEAAPLFQGVTVDLGWTQEDPE